MAAKEVTGQRERRRRVGDRSPGAAARHAGKKADGAGPHVSDAKRERRATRVVPGPGANGRGPKWFSDKKREGRGKTGWAGRGFRPESEGATQGSLPNAIANLSTNLQAINADKNMIRGNIPEDIGNLVSLSFLFMGNNYLKGSIPTSLGRLQRLKFLDLGMNNLTGEIPPAIGNLTLLNKLYLGQNSLGGPVTSSLGNCDAAELATSNCLQ
ncbi:hypothetical protein EJB05_24850, partial [Eragrostis curvula]